MGMLDKDGEYRMMRSAVKCIFCCLICLAIIVTLIVVLVAAFCIIRPIAVAVNDASLTRFALVSTPATALACDLSLTLSVRNPNWAMRIKNTKPLEAVYSFGGHKFGRVQLAGVGNEQGVKRTAVYRLTSGADSAQVALDNGGVAEFLKQNVTGAFELEVVVSGEIKYTTRGTKRKIEASCPLKLQLVSPGEAPSALVFDEVKCKLLKAD